METDLRAFHGDESIQQKYLTRVRAHRAADELIKGAIGVDGRGCAAGAASVRRISHLVDIATVVAVFVAAMVLGGGS